MRLFQESRAEDDQITGVGVVSFPGVLVCVHTPVRGWSVQVIVPTLVPVSRNCLHLILSGFLCIKSTV